MGPYYLCSLYIVVYICQSQSPNLSLPPLPPGNHKFAKQFTFISTTSVKSEQNINVKSIIVHSYGQKNCILPINGNNVSNGISLHVSLLTYFGIQVYITKNL